MDGWGPCTCTGDRASMGGWGTTDRTTFSGSLVSHYSGTQSLAIPSTGVGSEVVLVIG